MPKYQIRKCLGKAPQKIERMDGTKGVITPPKCDNVFNLLMPTGGMTCPACSAPTKLVEEYEAAAPRDLSKDATTPEKLLDDALEEEKVEKPKSTALGGPTKDRSMKSPAKRKGKKKKR